MKVNLSIPYTLGDVGGGTIQMKNTGRALESVGVNVGHEPLTENLREYDALHFFGAAFEFSRIIKIAKSKGYSVVVSPLHATRRSSLLWRSWGLVDPFLPVSTFYGMTKNVLDYADVLAVASDGEAQEIQNSFGVGDEKMTTVPLGINTSKFSNNTKNKFVDEHGKEDFVLQVSRINPVKGQVRLIKSLRNENIQVFFIGPYDGGSKSYFQKFKRMVRKNDNVHYLGFVEEETLVSAYRAARVHVLPSTRDLFGLVNLEAAACGCAVVSSHNKTLQSYIGEHIHFCDPTSTQSIRRETLRAFQKGSPNNLSKTVLKNFSWQKSGDKLKKVYKNML
jgi:glycosyltransferase involved in cell wall biosynthesis